MATKLSELIIPVQWLDDALNDATDEDGRETNAVTRATAFVNSYAVNYFPFPAYTENDADENSSSESSGSSEEADDLTNEQETVYTINAPQVVAEICLQVAIAHYKLSLDEVYRNGDERAHWTGELDKYKEQLRTLDLEPEKYSVAISLDSNGCQLVGRGPNFHIIPWLTYVDSLLTNKWNFGEHYSIRQGGTYDSEYYDGWYFDASNFRTTMEGTLYYYRSFRKDFKDFMKYYRQDATYTGYYRKEYE